MLRGMLPVLGTLVFTLGAFFSCSLVPDPRPSHRVVVASWNVQNLFDEVDDGDEYPEFDPGRGWTRAQFWTRCQALAQVIRTLGDGGPDILVLEEVEGAHALEVLNSRFLPDLGYRYSFMAPPQVAGVKTAFLSRFPLVRTGLHFPPSEFETEPLRPLVEAEFDLGGRALVVVGNHWKSRIPSPAATEHLRLASAQTLRARLTSLDQRSDHPFVVALGDFNTSLELSRSYADKALASASTNPHHPSFLVFAKREAAEKARQPGTVWDPWSTVASPAGSYVYRGDWDRLDHAFITAPSLCLSDWAFESFRVVAYSPEPRAYGPKSTDGVSDHFPLVVSLVRKSP